MPGAPVGESAPEFPPQRGPETPAPPRVAPQVPAPRPEAAERTERAEPDAPDAAETDEAAEAGGAAEAASGLSDLPAADTPGADPDEGDTPEAAAGTADASTRRPSASPATATVTATATAGATSTHGLGARERAVLEFERRRWKHAGAKEQAIRDEFDLSATRYYQILNALLDDPAALAHSPALVGRLRRVREARQRARH